ncbi:MAG TPA: 4Fe-4S binding protein [Anaerolineae bacterium]|nr:4Fe-4S binding protein [Anaerolineae bacterium]
MIFVDAERCSGCGACLEVCPSGALYLADGKATVDSTLCHDCEHCIAVCPTGALLLTGRSGAPTVEPVQVPAIRSEQEIIRVTPQPLSLPLRARAFPALGTALAWAGRAIMPRLADSVLDSLGQRISQKSRHRAIQYNGSTSRDGGREGRRHRHRRRGD